MLLQMNLNRAWLGLRPKPWHPLSYCLVPSAWCLQASILPISLLTRLGHGVEPMLIGGKR